MISALPLKQSLAHNEPVFMGIHVVETEGITESVPTKIQWVREEYYEIMPDSLPKTLPPRRGIDRDIELMLGLKPPTKNT